MKQVDILNFTNYQIAENGKVWSKKSNKFLKCNKDRNGYYFVYIKNNDGKYVSRFIHRLIAEAFIPNPDNKPCVDHISTNKEDNSIENLRWCTYKENNNNPISKKKLSEVNKGKHHTEQTKEKISRANYGRKLTLEQRKKISDARKEYWKKKS